MSFPLLPNSSHPSLLGLPLPPLPPPVRSGYSEQARRFSPDHGPVSYRLVGWGHDLRFDVDLLALRDTRTGGPWVATRPLIEPRLCIAHTNGASREGSIQSGINHGNRDTNNTKPHWLVNEGRALRVVPSNRRAIANSTSLTNEIVGRVKDVSFWSTAIETRDSGYIDNPGIDDWLFGPPPGRTHDQLSPSELSLLLPTCDAEIVAQIMAYESMIIYPGRPWGHPVEIPIDWRHAGVATHTWPHGPMKYTTVPGKICPGTAKKATFRDVIVPRAAQIRREWVRQLQEMARPKPPPPPPPPPVKFPPSMLTNIEIGENMTVLNPHRRIHDSRDLEQQIDPGETVEIAVAGASAVMANVTITGVETHGHLFDAGSPKTSFINGEPGKTKNSLVVLPVRGGKIAFTSKHLRCHVIVDLQMLLGPTVEKQ